MKRRLREDVKLARRCSSARIRQLEETQQPGLAWLAKILSQPEDGRPDVVFSTRPEPIDHRTSRGCACIHIVSHSDREVVDKLQLQIHASPVM